MTMTRTTALPPEGSVQAGMGRGRCRRLVCVALGLWVGVISLAAAQDVVRFTISDHLSAGQIEETITVYLDGRNVGTLHVHATKQNDQLQISVPRAERYDYALCGRLRLRSGNPAEREINDGGTLTDVDGRVFAAYNEGSAAFFLLDVTPHRVPVGVPRDDKPRCAAAIASR